MTMKTSIIIPTLLAAGLVAGCSAQGLESASDTSGAATAVSTTPASGAGTTAEEILADNIDVATATLDYDEAGAARIALGGDDATAEGAGVTVDGSVVTITAPGTYIVSGTLSDGQVIVDSAGDGLVQVVLAGASITSSTNAPLVVADADEVAVILADGTSNTLVDAAEYVDPDEDTDEPNAALFSTADLTIGGTGELAVVGNSNDGIASKDGLVIASGTITVTAIDDGLRGKDYLVVADGAVTVTADGDGLKSDNADDAGAGFIAVAGGTLEVTAGDDGLTAATDVVITGGEVTVSTGDDRSSDTGTAAKGILAEVALVVSDGSVTVDAADDALHSNGIITISDGVLTLAAGDDAVHADTDITITSGTIDITSSYEGLESADMTIAGGDITIVARDDGINLAGGDGSNEAGPGDQQGDFGARPGAGELPAGGGGGPGGFEVAGDYHLVISGGRVVIDSGGDGLDSNGTAAMSGGTVVVNGPTSNGDGAIDVNGAFEISGGTLVAVGSAGMAETPQASSEQAWLAGTFQTTQPAGTVLAVASGDEVLATFTASKPFASIVYSSGGLEAGQVYTVYTGATSDGQSLGGFSEDGSISGAHEAGVVTASGA